MACWAICPKVLSHSFPYFGGPANSDEASGTKPGSPGLLSHAGHEPGRDAELQPRTMGGSPAAGSGSGAPPEHSPKSPQRRTREGFQRNPMRGSVI